MRWFDPTVYSQSQLANVSNLIQSVSGATEPLKDIPKESSSTQRGRSCKIERPS